MSLKLQLPKTLSFLILSAVVLASCASPEVKVSKRAARRPASLPVSAALDLESIALSSEMPGLSVRVVDNGMTAFSYDKGLRALSFRNPVTRKDLWHIGSCTKPMTAYLIGQLIDEAALSLDTTVGQLLPHLTLARGVDKITIRMLLSHRSGLADVTQLKDSRVWPSLVKASGSSRKDRSKLVQAILETRPKSAPNSKTEYSNSGYVVLGAIVEELEDRSWEESVRDRVFNPLAMKSCGFGAPGIERTSRISQPWGHRLERGQLKAVPANSAGSDNPRALGPAGSVHCDSDDTAKFYTEVMNASLGRSQLLKPETARDLLSLSESPPYTLMSMGRADRPWARGETFGINGSNTLSFTSVLVAPRIGKVFLVNTNSGTPRAEAGVAKIMKLLRESSPQ